MSAQWKCAVKWYKASMEVKNKAFGESSLELEKPSYKLQNCQGHTQAKERDSAAAYVGRRQQQQQQCWTEPDRQLPNCRGASRACQCYWECRSQVPKAASTLGQCPIIGHPPPLLWELKVDGGSLPGQVLPGNFLKSGGQPTCLELNLYRVGSCPKGLFVWQSFMMEAFFRAEREII